MCAHDYAVVSFASSRKITSSNVKAAIKRMNIYRSTKMKANWDKVYDLSSMDYAAMRK